MSKQTRVVYAVLGLMWAAVVPSASAQCADQVYDWVTGSGNWSVPENWAHEEWDPDLEECVGVPGVPGPDTWAWIANEGTATITSDASVQQLQVDSSGATLLGGSLASPHALLVNWGGWFSHANGTVDVLAIDVGGFPGSSGSYDLQAGQLHTTGVDHIGNDGDGTFTQSGGTYTAGEIILARFTSNSIGSFELSGGDLSALQETVGYQGTGTFTHTGGTNTMINDLVIGGDFDGGTDASGIYFLSGGAALAARSQMVGGEGTGTFTQTGGTNTVVQLLNIAVGPVSDGTYDLSGDGELFAAFETVGAQGTGTFLHQAGTNTVVRLLVLGEHPGSHGTYVLHPEAVLHTASMFVGEAGTGVFTHMGGENPILGSLVLGLADTGDGTYELQGDGFVFAWSGVIGVEGTGLFVQTSAVSQFPSLVVGEHLGSDGRYELSAGLLAVGFEVIGGSGAGEFVQTGGVHFVPFLAIGTGPGSYGSYHLSDAAELIVGDLNFGLGELMVGRAGDGAFLQTGGTVIVVAEVFYLGEVEVGSGTYTLTGGELTHRGPNKAIVVGVEGSGALVVDGPSAQLDATGISVGTGSGAGMFRIDDPNAEIVVGGLTLGANATFEATPGASIHVTGDDRPVQEGGRGFVDNHSTDELALAGLENLNLICDGNPVYVEVGGADGGPDDAYCVDNFVIDTLTVNGVVSLTEDFDNGNRGGDAGWDEALYVNDLVFGPGGLLYTNAMSLYVNCEAVGDDPQICTGSERGDLDRDCDVDLEDYRRFSECFGESEMWGDFSCSRGDFDFNGRLDMRDFAEFQTVFTGGL